MRQETQPLDSPPFLPLRTPPSFPLGGYIFFCVIILKEENPSLEEFHSPMRDLWGISRITTRGKTYQSSKHVLS